MKEYLYPVWMVIWEDAQGDLEDKHVDDDIDLWVVHSVGWVIKEDDKKIVLGQDCGKDGWIRTRLVIPRVWVKKIRKLR